MRLDAERVPMFQFPIRPPDAEDDRDTHGDAPVSCWREVITTLA
jgi:hypothetical protein